MSKGPKIRSKDCPEGDKASWLRDLYTTEARAFYVKQHQQALDSLVMAAQASQDPNVARRYEQLRALDEILALLTYNEQDRDDD